MLRGWAHLVMLDTVHLFEPCERSSLDFLFCPVRLGRGNVKSNTAIARQRSMCSLFGFFGGGAEGDE